MWPMGFTTVGVATALEFACRSVSGFSVAWKVKSSYLKWEPCWIKSIGRSSQILHCNTWFATWSRQLWLVSLAMWGRQETEFSRMWWFCPVMCDAVSFHCDTLERVCRWHVVCKRMVKEETGNLYHCLLSTFRLEMKIIKSSGGIPRLSYTGRDDRHFVPTGLYIVRTVNGRKRVPAPI